jgi:hypothetical protein
VTGTQDWYFFDDGTVVGFVRTVAYDARTGKRLWSRLDHPGEWSVAEAMTLSRDGRTVVVTGKARDRAENGDDFLTIAYDARSGKILWRETVDSGQGIESGGAIAADPRRNFVYVTGFSVGETGAADTVVQWDATQVTVAYRMRGSLRGARVWTRRAGFGPTEERYVDAAIEATRSRVVTLGVVSADADHRAVVRAFSTRRGRLQWERQERSAMASFRLPDASLAVSRDGDSIFVGGHGATLPKPHNVLVISRLNGDTGAKTWTSELFTPLQDELSTSVRTNARGSRVYIAASSRPILLGPTDFMAVALEGRSGATSAEARFNTSGVGSDVAEDSALSPKGDGFYVTGTFFHDAEPQGDENYDDFGTVAFDI